jgi:ubiquinone biosynthesis protein
MDLLGLSRRQDQLKRIAEIAGVLSRYGLADWLRRIPSKEIRNFLARPETQAIAGRPWEERARLALTDLGTTFVKLGQVLSTRPDLVGPRLADELGQLQAGTTPDPPDVVRRTIEAELGRPPELLFAEFEPVALASASIGQVHRARLPDGQPVVVKVQHDGIQGKIKSDLELLQGLAELLQRHVPAARPYQPVATVREFRRTLLHELDFSSERRNLEEFARNFTDDPTVHIPVVYPALCSRRVLTMEMLVGIPGYNQAELHQSGADLNEFARRAARMYLNMIFRDGFYHADPHPGNYLLLAGTTVGVIDCGMIGRIDDSLRELFEDLLLALFQRDSEGLCDLLLRAGSAPVDIDLTAFRADVTEFLAEYSTMAVKEFDLGGALNDLTEIIRRHHLVLPSGVSLLLKTLIMLEGTAQQLNPDFSLMALLEPFQAQILRNRLSPRRWLTKFRRTYRDLDRLASSGPRNLAELLAQLREGRLEIRHEHRHLQTSVNRLVVGLLSSALFVGSSYLCGQGFPPVLGGVSVPGVVGCAVAVFLGAVLLRQIVQDT